MNLQRFPHGCSAPIDRSVGRFRAMLRLCCFWFPVWALVLGFAHSVALADGEGTSLRNGDFIDTWKPGNSPEAQALPNYWFASEVGTQGNPWVKVLDGSDHGVEIKSGDSPRFLWQDVRVDGGKTWTLKWKTKGQGEARVSVYPRDDDRNIFKATSKETPLSDVLQEDEMIIEMPSETTILRIAIAPRQNDSTVIFESINLSPSPGGGN